MLRVALLDDHPAVRAGLRRLIDSEPDMRVAAVASSAAGLARELEGLRPDVLILDYDLARDDGLAQCRRIKSRPNPPAVIVYSAYAGPALTLAARAAQADGVVDKAEPVHSLLTAVRRAGSGHQALDPVPRDAFESAVARLDDDDLPVFAMLLDREPTDSIAQALRTGREEIGRRAQRIVGRLRPRLGGRRDDRLEPAQAATGSVGDGRGPFRAGRRGQPSPDQIPEEGASPMRLFKRKASPDDTARCPECGERVPSGADECAMCGHHLAEPVDDAGRA